MKKPNNIHPIFGNILKSFMPQYPETSAQEKLAMYAKKHADKDKPEPISEWQLLPETIAMCEKSLIKIVESGNGN